MNKTAIKNFSIWARNKLIADVSYKAGLMGITASGIVKPLPQSTSTTEFYDIGTKEPYVISGEAVRQRRLLVDVMERKAKESDYATSYKYVLEEVAYTWFNRLIAIRFMEVNDYLPSHVRVLSSETGKMEPDLVTRPFDAELDFSDAERDIIYRLKQDNAVDELFQMLFIKQCNALNSILPGLFEKTNDYTELLLGVSVIDQDGVVYHLVHDIPEEDFDVARGGQVEIIGWLYQYYNTEPKNEAFAKTGKITKDEIPAVTQLFTPDWIVRYMVENSLGRIFIDRRKNEGIYADGRDPAEMTWDEIEEKRIANENSIAQEMGWRYYLPEAKQEPEVAVQLEKIQEEYAHLEPQDIKVIDPCMGSGHILVYAFDVLMQIYENAGWTQRDAARSILENNLYGLDIDDRAYQLAYFAVMMKARQYSRRILNDDLSCHVYSVQESNSISRDSLKYFGTTLSDFERNTAQNQILELLDKFVDAKEYGSILHIDPCDWNLLYRFATSLDYEGQLDFDAGNLDKTKQQLLVTIAVGEALARQYSVVVTNPPYMGSSGMSDRLASLIKKEYPDTKTDLYSVFVERCSKLTKKHFYYSMITQHGWMFLSSFQKLRSLIESSTIVNMVHLGARAFDEISGEVVQTTSFTMRRSPSPKHNGVYTRLIAYNSEAEKERGFFSAGNRYIAKQESYDVIPGKLIAYWVSPAILSSFSLNTPASKFADFRHGMSTSDNNKYLRLWFEPSYETIGFSAKSKEETTQWKWYIYLKGGTFRRWYGNYDYIVNWQNDGQEIKYISNIKYPYLKGNLDFVLGGQMYFFKPGYTWSSLTSGNLGIRKFGTGCLFDAKGQCYFAESEAVGDYLLAFFNSSVFAKYGEFLSPTLDFNSGVISKAPILFSEQYRNTVSALVAICVTLSKADWDAYETSWDFEWHPLIKKGLSRIHWNTEDVTIEECYRTWEAECDDRFAQLKASEEELNRIFIDIYGLQDELTSEIEDKDITVRRADLQRDIRGLLSFAVGCMFGRYSLGSTGLAFAGGEWDYRKYSQFKPDADNIIPLTDEDYLEDDIISRLCDFLKIAFGERTLETNLDYIAAALGGKGNSSREIIRSYFLNSFFDDHCQTYSVAGSGKRPIYWLFDSGKQNGFKALIYLHRYNADTIGNLRVDYLHKMQRVYESEIGRMQDTIDHSSNAREIAAATKRKEKLQKQLKECRDYDEKIGHLALSRIELDLDNGVKANYRKLQTAQDGKFYEVLAKSKDIMAKEK